MLSSPEIPIESLRLSPEWKCEKQNRFAVATVGRWGELGLLAERQEGWLVSMAAGERLRDASATAAPPYFSPAPQRPRSLMASGPTERAVQTPSCPEGDVGRRQPWKLPWLHSRCAVCRGCSPLHLCPGMKVRLAGEGGSRGPAGFSSIHTGNILELVLWTSATVEIWKRSGSRCSPGHPSPFPGRSPLLPAQGCRGREGS